MFGFGFFYGNERRRAALSPLSAIKKLINIDGVLYYLFPTVPVLSAAIKITMAVYIFILRSMLDLRICL